MERQSLAVILQMISDYIENKIVQNILPPLAFSSTSVL